LNLVLGAAHHHGAPVSLEMVHEAMGRTAERVGTAEFGNPELPDQHLPAVTPFEWVRNGREKMVGALDTTSHRSRAQLPLDSPSSERSTKVARPSIR